MSNDNRNALTNSVAKAIESFSANHLFTFGDVAAALTNVDRVQLSYEMERYRNRGKISYVFMSNRYIYCNESKKFMDNILQIEDGLKEILDDELALRSYQIARLIKEKVPDVYCTYRACRIILNKLFSQNVVASIPTLTLQGKKSKIFCTRLKLTDLIDIVCKIREFILNEKWTIASYIGNKMEIDVGLAGSLLRHLVFIGEIGFYRRGFLTIYYIPEEGINLDKLIISYRMKRKRDRYLIPLKKIFSKLNISSSTRKEARIILEEILKKEISKGRSIPQIVASVVMLASNKVGDGLIVDEVVQVLWEKSSYSERRQTRKFIRNSLRFLSRSLGLSTEYVRSKPEFYVHRALSRMEIKDRQFENEVMSFLLSLNSKRLAGVSPLSIVAASIYLLGREKSLTQVEVAKSCFVSEVTLRNVMQKINEVRGV